MSSRQNNKVLSDLQKLENPTSKDLLAAISASHSSIMKEISDINDNVNLLRIDNDSNKKRLRKVESEIQTVKKSQQYIIPKIDFLEQKQFESDLMISGLPEKVDPTEIQTKLGELLFFASADIKFSSHRIQEDIAGHRQQLQTDEQHQNTAQHLTPINNNKKSSYIIMRFNSLDKKEQTMKMVRDNGPIFLKQLLPDADEYRNSIQKIFINHRLTKGNLELLRAARKMKNEKKIYSTYISNSRIVVKINQHNKAQPIYNETNLQQLVNASQAQPSEAQT